MSSSQVSDRTRAAGTDRLPLTTTARFSPSFEAPASLGVIERELDPAQDAAAFAAPEAPRSSSGLRGDARCAPGVHQV